MEKKLKVKTINFETSLTFNEWVEKYKVSSAYIEPTKYFQGNPSCGVKPINIEENKNPILKFFFNV